MLQRLRRYEILLPLRFNDGRPVPAESLAQSRAEIEERFGALSVESQVIRGFDRETGSQDDRLIRLFVDVPDTPENLAFFQQVKGRMEKRFDQEAIRITRLEVEAVE